MMLSEQDAGRTVGMHVGDVVTIRLQENPTTGYRWAVEATGGLEQVGDRFVPGGAIGAAGIRSFEFRPPHAGAYELRMKHWRTWEGESSTQNRFNVKIDAK
jgi:inhibitor of cysteine peptidase